MYRNLNYAAHNIYLIFVSILITFFNTISTVYKRKLIYLRSAYHAEPRSCYPAGRRQTSFVAWLRFPPLHRISLAPERTILHLFRELFLRHQLESGVMTSQVYVCDFVVSLSVSKLPPSLTSDTSISVTNRGRLLSSSETKIR